MDEIGSSGTESEHAQAPAERSVSADGEEPVRSRWRWGPGVLWLSLGVFGLGVCAGAVARVDPRIWQLAESWCMKDRYYITKHSDWPYAVWRLDSTTGEVVLCMADKKRRLVWTYRYHDAPSYSSIPIPAQ